MPKPLAPGDVEEAAPDAPDAPNPTPTNTDDAMSALHDRLDALEAENAALRDVSGMLSGIRAAAAALVQHIDALVPPPGA